MLKQKYKVVFMGTPEIGVPTLNKLIDSSDYEVVGVFTNPDRPFGRNKKLKASPIKEIAEKNKIPVYQPERFNVDTTEDLLKLNPDLAIVIAYGQIIPKEVLKIPKYGFVNVHYSLLPKYRGAVPVQMSIKNGDKTTGITIQKMVYELDAGDIISQEEYDIGDDETTKDLWDKFSELGANQLLDTLPKFLRGEISLIKQKNEEATFCKQSDINKEKAKIDWNFDANEIHNLIRSLNPWPVAWTTLYGKRVKIFLSEIIDNCVVNPNRPGSINIIDNNLLVICGHGILNILEIQVEGKRKTTGIEFAKGLKGDSDFDSENLRFGT